MITPEDRLRNLSALVIRMATPTRVNPGKRYANNYANASKAELADAARQLAEEVAAYLDGTLEAVDEITPF